MAKMQFLVEQRRLLNSMTNWFEELEGRPRVAREKVPWPITIEFDIQSEYFISNLKALPKLDAASDAELLTAAQHCNNLIGWVEQMRIMGYTGLPSVIEELLESEFGSRQKLAELRQAYIEKWLHGKSGQHRIGVNDFTIHEGIVYYSTIHNEWFRVETINTFDMMPILGNESTTELSALLDAHHKPTRYQRIYASWQSAGYSGGLTSTLFSSKAGQTTPEEVLKTTVEKMHTIIERPLALREIEQVIGERRDHLEYLIKISCAVADFAQQRRASNEYTLYLLRDCAMFNEAQILIDLLEGQQTLHGQIYIGRESLSSSRQSAGHWYVCQELLLMSLQKHPDDFNAFYVDFTQRMKDYEKHSLGFSNLVKSLAEYLNNYIKEAEQNDGVITVVDLGFQGSINMILKYVLDRYCLPETKIQTDVHMYVVAEWFKDVYKNMFTSDTFSLLTNIEVMARNNAIYEYVPWSLRDGRLMVTYGSEADQHQADIELSVMTMAIILEKELDNRAP